MHLHFKPKEKDSKNFFPGRNRALSRLRSRVWGDHRISLESGGSGKGDEGVGPSVGSWKNPPFLTYMGSLQKYVTFFKKFSFSWS